MSKNFFNALILFSTFIVLLSNSTGVPQAVSKAPGESNHNSCATCHSPGSNYNPEINFALLDTNSNLVTRYTPGQTYTARVTVSGSNSPRGFGFQMTCLDSLTNADQGIWTNFGDRVRQINLSPMGTPRRYVTQSNTSTTGIFTMSWTAPNEDKGPVKFYYTGLAVNLNRTTTGDDNVFASSTFLPTTTSSTSSNAFSQVKIYPNPAQNYIEVQGHAKATVLRLVPLSGASFNYSIENTTLVDISELNTGFYQVQLIDTNNKVIHSQSLVKL